MRKILGVLFFLFVLTSLSCAQSIGATKWYSSKSHSRHNLKSWKQSVVLDDFENFIANTGYCRLMATVKNTSKSSSNPCVVLVGWEKFNGDIVAVDRFDVPVLEPGQQFTAEQFSLLRADLNYLRTAAARSMQTEEHGPVDAVIYIYEIP